MQIFGLQPSAEAVRLLTIRSIELHQLRVSVQLQIITEGDKQGHIMDCGPTGHPFYLDRIDKSEYTADAVKQGAVAKCVHATLATLGVVNTEAIDRAVVLQFVQGKQCALVELQHLFRIRAALDLLTLEGQHQCQFNHLLLRQRCVSMVRIVSIASGSVSAFAGVLSATMGVSFCSTITGVG